MRFPRFCNPGDWKKAGMDELAGDWLAGVAMRQGRPDIDPKKIGATGSANSVLDTMVREIGWSVREEGFSEAGANEAEADSWLREHHASQP